MREYTINEKVIFFFLIKNPEFFNESKKFFENNQYKRLAYYHANFYLEFGTIPTQYQLQVDLDKINQGAINAEGKWTKSSIDTFFDDASISGANPEWIKEQFSVWYNKRSIFLNVLDLIDTAKQFEKDKSLLEKILPFADKIVKHQNVLETGQSIFEMKSMDEWLDEAKNSPQPRQLFSSMIFEKETTILFGGPNAGKSTLAIQLCDAWSRGKSIDGFINECEPQKVMYIDFETSTHQLRARMHDEEENVTKSFDENFLRLQLKEYDDKKFKSSLEYSISKSKAKILVIDNISYLMDEGEKGKNSIELIKSLKEIRLKFNLTIVVLAHTPKIDESIAISINHLQGSKMLSNLADSVLGMKRLGSDENKSYLKQLKVRSASLEFGFENVCLFSKRKEEGMLLFKLEDTIYESELLDQGKQEQENNNRDQNIYKLHKEGKSLREIQKETGINKNIVSRILKKFHGQNEVQQNTLKQNDLFINGIDSYLGL